MTDEETQKKDPGGGGDSYADKLKTNVRWDQRLKRNILEICLEKTNKDVFVDVASYSSILSKNCPNRADRTTENGALYQKIMGDARYMRFGVAVVSCNMCYSGRQTMNAQYHLNVCKSIVETMLSQTRIVMSSLLKFGDYECCHSIFGRSP